MEKQKRFEVTRKNGTSYFVDEKDQVIEQPWDTHYYTAGTRLEESASPTQKAAQSEQHVELEQIRNQVKESYKKLGLNEDEAKLAADLDLNRRLY